MTAKPYTREAIARLRADQAAVVQPETVIVRLIATIEAAWAENKRLREEGDEWRDAAKRALLSLRAALARGDAAENKEEGNAD